MTDDMNPSGSDDDDEMVSDDDDDGELPAPLPLAMLGAASLKKKTQAHIKVADAA